MNRILANLRTSGVRSTVGTTTTTNVVPRRAFSNLPHGTGPEFSRLLYRYVLRSPSVFTAVMIVVGLVGVKVVDSGLESLWEGVNRGKLFHHVVPSRYPNLPPGTGEEEEDDDDDDDDDDEEEEEEE